MTGTTGHDDGSGTDGAAETADWRIEVPTALAGLVSEFGPLHPDAQQHMVRMRDGARLATDVYLPGRPTRRVPTVLIRTCYDKTGPLLDLPAIAQHLTDAGFAAVVQDVRGRFRSEGERSPFVHELTDGYDTLDWLVAQPFSDGAVGMWGTSYLGFAAWAAAASEHPALRALSLRFTSQIVPTTWWAPHLASPAGTEWLVSEWSCAARLEGSVLDWARRPYDDVVPADLDGPRQLQRRLRTLAADPARLQTAAFPAGLPGRRLRIPALHSAGWWDPINQWSLRDWQVVRAFAPAAADQRLVIGATDHMGVRFGASPGAEHPPAGEQLGATVEFFDQWLRKRAAPEPGPPVRYETAAGTGAPWADAECWPPPGLRPWTLYLADTGRATSSLLGGALRDRPDRAGATARWIHDPSAPVPALGVGVIGPIPHEAATHLRSDVATFTSEPMRRPVDLVGPIQALLEVSSSAPSTHLVATLIDLGPDGVVHQLVEGITLVDTLHGSTCALVDLGATAFRLGRGHRLRLAVASSRFPSYLPHPGTNGDVWTAVETYPAEQELHTGGSPGSQLRLYVRPAR